MEVVIKILYYLFESVLYQEILMLMGKNVQILQLWM